MTNPSRRAEQVATGTPDVLAERVEQLRHLFPEAFSEGKVDPEKLCACLGEFADERPERYSFTWAGKRDAIRLLQTPSQATLVPAPEESVSFEQTNNIFIEGENLEVLKLLYKSYFGRVKMIYIDPPYNTGNDFIYPDHYADPLDTYLKLTGQKDGDGNLLTSNPETSGRYHSNWLSMMYPRLFLARQLLREDGVICVSIGDEELPNLRLLMNEVYGEENHRNTILVRRYDKNINRQFMGRGLMTLNVGAEYVVIYARSSDFAYNPVYREASEERQNSGYWKGFWNAANRPTMRYELLGVTPKAGQWKWKKEVALEAVSNYEFYQAEQSSVLTLEEYWEKTGKVKKFIRRNPSGRGKNEGVEHWIPPSTGILRSSNWMDLLASGTLADLSLDFDNPKNVSLLRQLILMCCDETDIILDFFAGSCTVAHAILELNRENGSSRRFIAVQLPEPTGRPDHATIAEIGRSRIFSVVARLKKEKEGQMNLDVREEPEDMGVKVFRLAKSSLRPWTGVVEKDAEAYAEQIALFTDPLVEGWTTENVVYEVALKEGYGLNCQIGRVEAVGENAVYRVADPDKDQSFYISLDNAIRLEGIRPLGLTADDLFICRDCALDDETAANLALQCRLKTI